MWTRLGTDGPGTADVVITAVGSSTAHSSPTSSTSIGTLARCSSDVLTPNQEGHNSRVASTTMGRLKGLPCLQGSDSSLEGRVYIERRSSGNKLQDVVELAQQLQDIARLAGPEEQQAAAACAAIGAELISILTGHRDSDPVLDLSRDIDAGPRD